MQRSSPSLFHTYLVAASTRRMLAQSSTAPLGRLFAAAGPVHASWPFSLSAGLQHPPQVLCVAATQLREMCHPHLCCHCRHAPTCCNAAPLHLLPLLQSQRRSYNRQAVPCCHPWCGHLCSALLFGEREKGFVHCLRGHLKPADQYIRESHRPVHSRPVLAADQGLCYAADALPPRQSWQLQGPADKDLPCLPQHPCRTAPLPA